MNPQLDLRRTRTVVALEPEDAHYVRDTMGPPPPDKPGSDNLPNAWLFNQLNRLEDVTREQHQRLRSEMAEQFHLWSLEFKKHEDFDYETRRMVERLTIQREDYEKNVQRRSSVFGAIAASLVAALVELVKKLFGVH